MGRIEARYGAQITGFIEPFKELVEAELFPMLDYITQARPVKLDAAGDDIRKIFEKIRIGYAQTFSEKAVTNLARNSADVIDTINHKTFRNQTKTVLGVDPIFAEPWLADEVEAFVHENASLIKTIPTEHLSDIEQMVFRESRRGASPSEIKQKIKELFGAADRSAALIARDQIAKFNGRLSELRQTSAGVTEYIWRTSDDGRVRSFANSNGYSSHARLDDEKFSWKNPPITVFKGKRAGERNHPGQDINCRCYAEPVLDKLIKGEKNAAPI
jgi:SPP1 gp7 family putative phage head morphogenesis protein